MNVILPFRASDPGLFQVSFQSTPALFELILPSRLDNLELQFDKRALCLIECSDVLIRGRNDSADRWGEQPSSKGLFPR